MKRRPCWVVLANGTYVGDISAWPDSVARQLGCTFPQISGDDGIVDLTPHKTPDATPGEPTIGRWTIRQWLHMVAHDSDWSILLDGAGQDTATTVIARLADPAPAVRTLACRMLDAIGYIGDSKFGLGSLAGATLDRLRALAADDPDAGVRAAARKTADSLAESIDLALENVRRKMARQARP
jgi:hypothetical protein